VAGQDVLFSLLMDLEEQEVQVAVVAGTDQLLVAPPQKLSMRLQGELRRHRHALIKERRLTQLYLEQAVFLLATGQAEAL
jgi:hypothetical protein